eukprot:TRINITY_DN68234_c0_g1_i1.p1 TRINITY_DN68234_c0_g1~~TRINITY_DN68234_c0_g1_i1.p1  ORF type:complete len:666 (-),score=141.74 TRINITY_DN68234_c0_g1_i1:157-2046(-)
MEVPRGGGEYGGFGFADDYEWGIAWDFQRDSDWSPPVNAVFPPSPSLSDFPRGGGWKKSSKGGKQGGMFARCKGFASGIAKGGKSNWGPPGPPPGPPPPNMFVNGDSQAWPSSLPPWSQVPSQLGQDGLGGGGSTASAPPMFPNGHQSGAFGSMIATPPWKGGGETWNGKGVGTSDEEWWATEGCWDDGNHDEDEDEQFDKGGKSASGGSKAISRGEKSSKGRGRSSRGGGKTSAERHGDWQAADVASVRNSRPLKWQSKGAARENGEAREEVAVIDAFLEHVGPPLRKGDFDNRVRRTLSGIRADGGVQLVESALAMVQAAVAQKPRQTVRNWPGYIVTLLKRYNESSEQSSPLTVGVGRAGGDVGVGEPASDEIPPGLPASAIAARALREPRAMRRDQGVSSTSWAAVDQEERTGGPAVAPAMPQSVNPTPSQSPEVAPSPVHAVADLGEDEVDDWPVRKALRKGRLVEALDLVSKLPDISAQVAGRILSALGRAPTLNEEVMDKLMDLDGRFSANTFEVAAAEAQQRGDTAACNQLYQVAGLMSIPKTPEALTHLLQGLASDPSRARSIVEELVSKDSDVRLTQAFAEALVAVCAAAQDTELASAVREKAIADGITMEMPEVRQSS